jgi:hypothetical protein
VDAVAKTFAAKEPLDDSLATFGKAAKCETDAKKASLFRRAGAPTPAEEEAFKELVKSISGP